MADEEEVKSFVRKTVEEQKCNASELKQIVSHNFNDVILNLSDITFIEDEFVTTVLKLWKIEYKENLECFIDKIRSDKNELKIFCSKINENDFDTFQNLFHTQYGDLIECDRNIFDEESLRVACSELVFHTKKKIEEIRSDATNDYKFVKCLIEVLRNSGLKYDDLLEGLKLRKFINEEISIHSLNNLIIKNNFKVDSYDSLKKLASNFKNANSEDLIRQELSPYVKQPEIKITEDTQKVIGKILLLHKYLEIPKEIKELQIICDVLNVCNVTTDFFHYDVDNLVIIANEIKVYDAIKIDLSGQDAREVIKDKQDNFDGLDGYAGESGGNIAIFCSKIENSNLLTLISNGGNGTNATDGKNGRDGEDGKDVEKENLSWGGAEFRVKTFQGLNRTNLSGFPEKLTKDSHDDFEKLFVNSNNYFKINRKGLLLVKGKEGILGSKGGLGGLGGEGGFKGEIKVDVALNVSAIAGTNGLDGQPGLNGIDGRDGGDAWAYDKQFNSDPLHFGLGEKKRFEMVKCKEEEYSIWSANDNSFVKIAPESFIPAKCEIRLRNDSRIARSRASYAKAKKKNVTFNSRLKSQYSEYLRDNSEILNKSASKYEDINLQVEEIKFAEKIKIKTTCECPTIKSCVKSSQAFSFNLVFFSFEEVKEKILKPKLKLQEFMEILRKSNLNTQNWLEIKKHFKPKVYSEKLLENYLEATEKDFQILLNDKICLSMLENVSVDVKFNSVHQKPNKTELIIPYLINTGGFKENFKALTKYSNFTNFATLHYYFTADEKQNREQIRSFYNELEKAFLGESPKGFMSNIKSIFGKSKNIDLNEVKKLFTAILKTLFKYKNQIEIKDELESLQTKLNQLEDLESKDFVTKFVQNGKISKFINTKILEHGIALPIYRKILSFAFQVDINIFIKRLDGSITLCEENKVEDFYENIRDTPVVNLLIKGTKFTLLKIDQLSYDRDQSRIKLTSELKKELEKFKPQEKISNSEFPLINYFEGNSETLNHFEYLVNISSTIEDLNAVAPLIVKSINTRLFYEENMMSSKEFHTILYTVLDFVIENSFMIEYFAVKFLILHHSKWIKEIIKIHIQNYLNMLDLSSIDKHLDLVTHRESLLLFLIKIEQLEKDRLSLKDFNDIVYNMQYFTNETYEQLQGSNELSSWKFIETTGYFLNKYKFLTLNDGALINDLQCKYGMKNLEKFLNLLNEKSISSLNIKNFLENFLTGEWIFSNELFAILEKNPSQKWLEIINEIYSTKDGQRSIDQVIRLVSEGDSQASDSSIFIKSNINDIGEKAKRILKGNYEKNSTEDRLARIIKVFEDKLNFTLRNTQIISILILWYTKQGALLQIGTGEGKTFIAVAFAILKALNGEKVHVVSSSKVLAERDATSEENTKIFKAFGIKVGHNCSEDSDERRRVYQECDVVYGTLGNFQRDYLFTKFFNQNFFPQEHLQNVLIDEVDSILLDKGNNILYLSQELPGADELESAFIFLWQFVNQNAESVEQKQILLMPENIRSAFLDNLYGVVDKEDLVNFFDENKEAQSELVLKRLKDLKMIDTENCIKIENFDADIRKLSYELGFPESVKSKIIYLITQKFNSPKLIKFPKFYTNFVMHHLDRWIESAISALLMEDGRAYVIDRVRDGSAIRNDPNIIIMDVDTGTDQRNSEWDEGLCQFLQLKHGCRLSLLSLKSVFVSNVTYFSYYKERFGITGTLGSKSECEKIEDFYKLQYATIPTYLPKKFVERETLLANSGEEWLNKIINEVKAIFKEDRSVLIICNTIKEIQVAQNRFQNDESRMFNSKNMHIYQRDYEQFDLGKLQTQQLIIATNLAGRGTDIKLSDKLTKNGGLHVILTYLASNIRIENQAYGRAARAGAEGSGRLIIMRSSDLNDINEMKEERNRQERLRLENVSEFYKNFTENEEKLFAKFTEHFSNYEKVLKRHYKDFKKSDELQLILCDNIKYLWSLWLDENSKLIAEWGKNADKIQKLFDLFISKTKEKKDYNCVELHPIMRIRICTYLESIGKLNEAQTLFDSEKFKDSIAYEHLKVFLLLKSNSNRENRLLTRNEIKEIRKLIFKLSDYETELSARVAIINSLKNNYQSTLIAIQGFSIQTNEIIVINRIRIDSLAKILGRGVTPDTFTCAPFGNQIFNEEFYEFLLKNDYIKNGLVDSWLNLGDVGKKYNLDSNKLKVFLNSWNGKEISSFDDFTEELNKNINFASRESFWNALLKANILKNEVKYAIIDIQTIREYLPCSDVDLEKYNKIQELTDKNSEIFFENVYSVNEKIKSKDLFVIEYCSNFKRDRTFQFLLKKKLVKFNSKATFDLAKFKSLKENFKFDHFDSVNGGDFNFIKSSIIMDEVINALVNANVLEKKPKFLGFLWELFSSPDYHLKFDNFEKIDLGKNSIYESDVISLLTSKFQFRISLEILAHEIENKRNQVNIHLQSNPHLMLMQDLISKFIILPSQVNLDKYQELESDNIFDKYILDSEIIKYLKNGIFNSSFTLPANVDYNHLMNYLIDKKVLFKLTDEMLKIANNITNEKSNDKKEEMLELGELKVEILNYIQYRFSSLKKACSTPLISFVIRDMKENVKLPDRFKNIESSVRVLLARRKQFIDNKHIIIQAFNDCLESFKNKEYEEPEPVIVSLITSHEMLCLMQLKGLGYVIQISDKKYSLKYYLKVASTLLIGIAQIAVGVILTLTSGGGLINVGTCMISEGISDIMYALCTLQSGTFKWNDYKTHKIMSVLVTVSVTMVSLGLARLRILNKTPVITLGDKMAGKGYAGKGAWQIMKGSSLQTKLVTLKFAGKELVTQVSINTIKAFSMAGVSMGADYIIKNMLDNGTLAIAGVLTTLLHQNFESEELSQTIRLLLNIKSEKDTEELIMKIYFDIMNANDYMRQLLSSVGDKVSNIISAGFTSSGTFNRAVTFGFMATVKTIALTSLACDIRMLVFTLNNFLKKEIGDAKSIKVDEEKVKEGREKFKTKIFKKIDDNLKERVKTSLNQNIIAPTLKMVANKCLASAASSLTNALKEHLKKKRENKFEKEAIELNQQLSELKEKENLTSDEKLHKAALIEKALRIKGSTSNPETFAKLMLLNLPMGDVELEAAARKFGIRIIVEFDNVKNVYGSEDATDTVELKLKDGHFDTTSDGSDQLTNDCLYRSLKDKGVDMQGIEAKDFAQKLANDIVSNHELRAIVADPRRPFWRDIGFYGGYQANQKPKPRIEDKNTEIYKTFINEEYYETGVKCNADIRKSDGDKFIQLESKDNTEYNKLRSQATENVIENVEKALIEDAMKYLKMQSKNVDSEVLKNIFDLDDFEGTIFSGILTKNKHHDVESKFAVPVEMKSKYDKVCSTIDGKISAANARIASMKAVGHNAGNLEASVKILNQIKQNFQGATISFDHVTETSALQGDGNNGPNAPHVGIELIVKRKEIDVKKCFHSIIPQFKETNEENFNNTIPGRIQNNENPSSSNKTYSRDELNQQGIIELDAKKIYSSTSKFNNFLIASGGAKSQNEFYNLEETLQKNIPSNEDAAKYKKNT